MLTCKWNDQHTKWHHYRNKTILDWIHSQQRWYRMDLRLIYGLTDIRKTVFVWVKMDRSFTSCWRLWKPFASRKLEERSGSTVQPLLNSYVHRTVPHPACHTVLFVGSEVKHGWRLRRVSLEYCRPVASSCKTLWMNWSVYIYML